MRTVLFYRRFLRFRGGHLKVWDYYNHVRSFPNYRPQIHFSTDTVWNESNPWLHERNSAAPEWNIDGAHTLFLSGIDWKMLAKNERREPPLPIINLIQHVRNAQPTDRRYRFLKFKAIRVCVSEEVGHALEMSRQVNGPLFVIPNGIDSGLLSQQCDRETRDTEVLVVGLKQPELAQALRQRLETLVPGIEVLTKRLPRQDFLGKLRRTRITVFLPNPTEGFYLPAVEGMAVGTLVICPDCVGNRSFCLPSKNCFRPEYTVDGLEAAVQTALSLPQSQLQEMLSQAKETAQRCSLARERQRFFEILENISNIW